MIPVADQMLANGCEITLTEMYSSMLLTKCQTYAEDRKANKEQHWYCHFLYQPNYQCNAYASDNS